MDPDGLPRVLTRLTLALLIYGFIPLNSFGRWEAQSAPTPRTSSISAARLVRTKRELDPMGYGIPRALPQLPFALLVSGTASFGLGGPQKGLTALTASVPVAAAFLVPSWGLGLFLSSSLSISTLLLVFLCLRCVVYVRFSSSSNRE